MNRYPKYKPTGIAWLPEVPEGWECCKLRQFLTPTSRKGYADKKLLSVTREQGVIIRDIESKEENHNFIPDDLSNYKLVEIGDFAVNKMKSWQGSYGVSQHEGIVSPAYYTFKVSGVDGSFFSAAIRSRTYVSFFARYSKGIRVDQWDLSAIALRDIPFALPPLPTQRAIVAYLDEKCGKVDRLVAAKEKEAALLKELKQSMIAEAVTGATQVARTDAARKMKPSGIPWLPEVPEGWEVKRVATLLKIKDCPSAPNEELLSVFLDRGVIRFSEGGEKRANATSKDLSKYQLVEVDDFVMNNQQAWRGSVGISRYRGIVSPAYFVVRLADCIDSKYAEYAFRSRPFVSVYELCSRGVGSIQRNLIWNMFKQQHFPLPPLAEQREIVAHIEARAAKIDAAVEGLEREVAALKEYKQRLIADVVTGQRKVVF